MKVYILFEQKYGREDDVYDVVVGVYSSEELCEAKKRLLEDENFLKNKYSQYWWDDFTIDE